MKTIDVIALIILILGGLNWGIVGIARYDVIAEIFGRSFGHTTAITRLIYIIIGLAALYVIWFRITGLRRPGQPRV